MTLSQNNVHVLMNKIVHKMGSENIYVHNKIENIFHSGFSLVHIAMIGFELGIFSVSFQLL